MTRYSAPPPADLRHGLRARQHPALGVPCPHCAAKPHQPCTTVSKRHRLAQPHPGRHAAWARTVACCPTCQVTPTIPCHTDGRALDGVHAARYHEAEVTT